MPIYNTGRPRSRAGIVLLMMLLVVVVLGVMVYFFGIYPQDRQTKRVQEQSPDEYPWVEERRIKRLGLQALTEPCNTEDLISEKKLVFCVVGLGVHHVRVEYRVPQACKKGADLICCRPW